MAIRIAGVDIPQNKRGEIALTYIFGIGRSSAVKILAKAGVDKDIKAHLVERLGRVESISHVKGCGETGKIESRTATTFRPKKKGPGLPAGA